jgi:hypothetical protein
MAVIVAVRCWESFEQTTHSTIPRFQDEQQTLLQMLVQFINKHHILPILPFHHYRNIYCIILLFFGLCGIMRCSRTLNSENEVVLGM